MKKWALTAVAVALVAFGAVYFFGTPATFTIVQPFIAPASPSGLAIPSFSAPASSFPISVTIDGHGHATRDISVSVDLRPWATAPAKAMTISQPIVTGNTVASVAKNPTGGAFSNVAVAQMTWSGKYDVFPGLSRPFSKTVNIVFPGIDVVCPFIPSRGTATCSVSLGTKMDFPVTVDLVGNFVTLGSSSVTFPAATATSGQIATTTINVTAPLFRCADAPGAVPGGLCVGGSIDASSKFGGPTTLITRHFCATVTCEGPR